MKRLLQALTSGCLGVILTAIPVLGAERVSFSSPVGELSISINSLDKYVQEDKKDDELTFYAQHLTPQELAQLKKILQHKVKLSPVVVAQFLYSSMGAQLLQYLGDLVQTDARVHGFYALRSALILAAADSEGLTVLNVLKKFPITTMRINSKLAFELMGVFDQLVKQTDKVTTLIEQQSQIEAVVSPTISSKQPLELQQSGLVKWQKHTLALNDRLRSRKFLADFYLPEVANPAAVLVISHGVGSDRNDFADLARHLASHGFAVAAVEHPGSNNQQLQSLFKGGAREVVETREFINRPKDVSYLLDELERLNQSHPLFQGRLNLQQIGVLGHSFGGYTALALAGAEFNFQQLKQECRADNFNLNAANVSLLLQCLALNLPNQTYNLQDKRIQAVFAMKPFSSGIFGEKGLSQVTVPVMLVAGSDDTVTPAVVEQICPFTWLKNSDKYLVWIQNGTHVYDNQEFASTFAIANNQANPDPTLARDYLKAMSLGFAKTYVAGELEYRNYLTPSYVETISQFPLPLKLVRSLSAKQLSLKQNLSCPGSDK